MSIPHDTPTENEVRAQFTRICLNSSFSDARKLQKLLGFLVDGWLLDGGESLSEKSLGEQMKETRVPAAKETSAHHGYPQTRANLRHVRFRLSVYYERGGYFDPVIIKLVRGSYAPNISYNRNPFASSELDPYSEKLIFRMKAAMDRRTLPAAHNCLEYCRLLKSIDTFNPRVWAIAVFGPYPLAPVMPHILDHLREQTENDIAALRELGFDSWEISFSEGCIQASHYHDWLKALGLLQTAVANSQDEAKYFWWYTALLASFGFVDKSIEILESALRHFGRGNVGMALDLAMLQIIAKRYADAEETLSALADSGQSAGVAAAAYYIILYEAQDRLEDAKQLVGAVAVLIQDLVQRHPDSDYHMCYHHFFAGMMILVAGRMGDTADAVRMTENLAIGIDTGFVSPFEAALAYIGIGAADKAVEYLEKLAFNRDEPLSMWYHIFPPLRHLNNNPSFQSLLKRLNLPPQRPH